MKDTRHTVATVCNWEKLKRNLSNLRLQLRMNLQTFNRATSMTKIATQSHTTPNVDIATYIV